MLNTPMHTTVPVRKAAASAPMRGPIHRGPVLLLAAIFIAVYLGSLFSPSLLDDADATHASAARHMAVSGDWVTLYVDGIRYLEKPPLPYWLVAIDYKLFGFNAFATHLPLAISVLLLAALGWQWGRLAWGERAGTYAALGLLTSVGVFLFTRYFIPDVLLTLFLSISLYCFLRGLSSPSDGPLESARGKALHMLAAYVSLGCAVLTKGLIAPVFFGGTVVVYLFLTGELCRWRELRPLSGSAIFLAIAAPWHILASLRNRAEGLPAAIPTPGNHHGFLWFYFVNEHVLRFLGTRYPMDYNKLPASLYWSLHLVWLFPWSLFLPAFVVVAWRLHRAQSLRSRLRSLDFASRTTLLLSTYSALILVFFSLSTNQEYYTFPVYLPLMMLTAAALVRTEEASGAAARPDKWLMGAHLVFTAAGIMISLALAYGIWSARHLGYISDIGGLLAHRGVGDYTLSMSHFFDLTGESFAALRLPAALAMVAFAFGPAIAWRLRARRRDFAATLAVGVTSALFLIAAHIALARFDPMLSSRAFADTINRLTQQGRISADTEFCLYSDQSYGSSILFYTGRTACLVDGRTSSMIWGSTYTDAPKIFLTGKELAAEWGFGPRKLMFVPMEKRAVVDALLGRRQVLLQETSGKALITDRPLP